MADEWAVKQALPWLQTQFDTRYATVSGSVVVDWSTLTGKPAAFPPSAHTHPTSEVSGLDTQLQQVPTPGQKNALGGTSGTPGATNQFVTTQDPRNSDARTPTAHTHAQSEVTGLPAALTAKVDTSDARLSDARTPTAHTHPWAQVTGPPATYAPSAHTHPESEVTNLVSDLAAKALATEVPNASYRTLLEASGSHTAARAAGTYGMGHGDPLAVSGTGTLYPLATVFIDSADYPTLGAKTPKLRVRAQLYTNDVAPTGNFTVGLHPITRPATSGGAGLAIYTLGAAVTGSTTTFTTPVADGLLAQAGSDFALPANGHYVLGCVTTAAVATSAHVHLNASLQMRNT